jgi:hypothetical protein
MPFLTRRLRAADWRLKFRGGSYAKRASKAQKRSAVERFYQSVIAHQAKENISTGGYTIPNTTPTISSI